MGFEVDIYHSAQPADNAPQVLQRLTETPYDHTVVAAFLNCSHEAIPAVERYLNSREGRLLARKLTPAEAITTPSDSKSIGHLSNPDGDEGDPACTSCGHHIKLVQLGSIVLEDIPDLPEMVRDPTHSWIEGDEPRIVDRPESVCQELFKCAPEYARVIGALPVESLVSIAALTPEDRWYDFLNALEMVENNFFADMHNLALDPASLDAQYRTILAMSALHRNNFHPHLTSKFIEKLTIAQLETQFSPPTNTHQKIALVGLHLHDGSQYSPYYRTFTQWLEQNDMKASVFTSNEYTPEADNLETRLMEAAHQEGTASLVRAAEQLPSDEMQEHLAALVLVCILDGLTPNKAHGTEFWKKFNVRFRELQSDTEIIELIMANYEQARLESENPEIGHGFAKERLYQKLNVIARTHNYTRQTF